MPWCPHCDEIFPEGPACPRCRAPLMDTGRAWPPEEAAAAGSMPALKVPRRLRRAFGRLSGPVAPPRQLVAFALALVLLAGGFALGRMSAVPTGGPIVRPLPGSGLGLPARGYLDFVGRVPGAGAGVTDLSLVRVALRSGLVDSLGRFSSPFGGGMAGREGSGIVAYRDSVAVVLYEQEGRSAVGAFASRRRPVHWLEGAEAAWESEHVLLVRRGDGSVTRWALGDGIAPDPIAGTWGRLYQAWRGAVLEEASGSPRGLYLAAADGLRQTIGLPDGARTVAVSSEATAAFVVADAGFGVWDGERLRPVTLDAYDVLGAAFSPDGERVAVTVRERSPSGDPGPLMLAVVGADGTTVALRRLVSWSGDPVCAATPAWEPERQWVFVAPGDGSVYAAEVGSTRVTRAAAVQNVGCGIAWSQ